MHMASPFNRAYFQNRLDRNRALAARSQNPVIRNLHLEYVRLYEGLLSQHDLEEQLLA
ncbi:MAG: hypothetical protein PSY12_08445 [bacterium]|nr:hypothetical protein [bacterium]